MMLYNNKAVLKQHDNAVAVLMRLLKDYVRPYSITLFFVIFCMTVAAGCTAAIVKLVQPVIDKVFITRDSNMLAVIPLMMLGIHSIKGVAEYYQNYFVKYIGQKILTDLQIKMYEHLLFADLAFIQAQSSGKLISRFTNDIALMRGAVSNLLVGCAKHLLSILFLIVLMFKQEPRLSAIVFIVFPVAIYPIQKLGRRMRKISTQSQEELGNYTATLDATFQSIKIIKSFAGEQLEAIRARKIANNILEFYKKIAKFDALTSPIMEILSGIAIGGIVWYGGLLVIQGVTTTGAIFSFITAFVSIYRPFKSLVALNVNLQEGIAAAKRVFALLDTSPSIKDNKNAQLAAFAKTQIRFSDVRLEFHNKNAIKSLNLTIEHGQITAIVGRSGGGKTSLVNLLVRLYDPTSGKITIDDKDITSFTIKSLRQQVALVTQDTVLFDTTVADNIAYGLQDATREQIIAAAQFADAHEFICNLPSGYDEIIGNQGLTLSGGQRQRLAIARAILKNAPIIVLDEATSALDPNSEKTILSALKTLCPQKTILMITHRISSIAFASTIVVMKAGKVLESGSHAELLANKAEYYKLYNKELLTE